MNELYLMREIRSPFVSGTGDELECMDHSQHGESEIISELVSKIPTPHRFCVEFGAWDGKNLSNTFTLVERNGWRALYIEGNPRRSAQLKQTATEFPTITAINTFISTIGNDSLNSILSRQHVPADFELLSIDVDGADYDIWESLAGFTPSIVIVEHNSSMPPGFHYVDRGGLGFIGSSATALCNLAHAKGYDLVACTLTNSVFLRDDLFSRHGLARTTVEAQFDRRHTCFAFRNHAGEIVLSNPEVANSIYGPAKWVKHTLFQEKAVYQLGQPYHANALTRAGRAVLERLRRR